MKHILPGEIKDHKEIEKKIIEFAKTELNEKRAIAYQMSLIPSETDSSSAMSDEDLLAEGYRQLNRLLF